MLLTGSEIVLEVLAEQQTTTVFGYPGGNVLSLYDKLRENKKGIRHILTAHEQGAVHAADGYSRAGKGIGVVVATSGPGATNIVTGLATAYADSIPLVAITGSVPTTSVGTDSFQEIDTASLTLAVTKYSFFVKDIKKLAQTMRNAFRIAQSGRPGPVLVDIPHDIQKAVCSFEPAEKVKPEEAEQVEAEQIQQAAALFNQAKRPMIYCGGGVIRSKTAHLVRKLVEKSGAYVAFSMMGISAMELEHSKNLGMAGMYGKMAANQAIAQSDVLLAIGTRFSDRGTGNREAFARNAKIIHMDVDEAELGKVIPADIELTGDMKGALEALILLVEEKTIPQWEEEIKTIQTTFAEEEKEGFTPKRILEALRQMTEDTVPVSTDVGQHQMWTSKYYSFRTPGAHLTSGGFGTMGYGMGAAIGASVATKGQSLLVTGDGSFTMNMQEVTTAVRNQIPVTVLVLDNGGLGMIRQLQDCFCDGRRFSTELQFTTDFAALARAMGADGYQVSDMETFEEVYKKTRANQGPTVIDCRIAEKQHALPMIPPNGAVEDRIEEKDIPTSC